MMKEFLLCAAAMTLAVQAAPPQGRTPGSVRDVSAGEIYRAGSDLKVKVTRSAESPFKGVEVKGEALIAVLELDAGTKNVTLFYNVSADSRTSGLHLKAGTRRYAPRAVMEDFPSWGPDNDKEIEVLDPEDTDGDVTVQFKGKGYIYLLFDVPPARAAAAKKLSLDLRTGDASSLQHSYLVSL